jgi:UDP-glucose 4-epimerase
MSPYGITKVAMELYVGAWTQIFGMSGISLRYANVYGPRQNHQGEAGVVAIFCHRLLTDQAPVINGDGGQTRDFVYVGDVARANLLALERSDATGGINIATGIETSVNDIYAGIKSAAGSSVAAQYGPARPGEQRRSCLDPKLAERIFGWRPTVTLDEGLTRTYDFFRKELSR